MKHLYFVLLVFTLYAAVGSVHAQTPLKAAEMQDYVRECPSLSMTYHVHTGRLDDKPVQFVCQNEKYAYTWREPKTNQVLKMFTYDGTHCYSMRRPGLLEVSTSTKKDPSLTSSWFVYNPLFNPFSVLYQKSGEAFEPLTLTTPEAKEVFANQGKLDGNTATVDYADKSSRSLHH